MVTYVHIDLGHCVVAVLVNDTLGSLLELLNDTV